MIYNYQVFPYLISTYMSWIPVALQAIIEFIELTLFPATSY